MVISASCRSTTLPTENLSTEENELFCKGTKNMIAYLKLSQEIKSRYGDVLYNNEQIGLKIDNKVFKGLPFGQINELDLEPTDTVAIKKLTYQCYNQSNNNPDFDVTFYFLPESRVLSALVMIVLDKPGYRSGFQFSTKLGDNGQLGQMIIRTIQE